MLDAAKPSRLARATRRGRWPLTGALVVALLAASWALVGLIDGVQWWWLLVGFGTVLLLVPAILRTLGVPRLLASLLDLILFALCCGAILGIPPTLDGLARIPVLLGEAVDAVQRASIPAAPVPELLGLVLAAGGIVAVLLDLAAVTIPSLVGLILLVTAAVPAFLLPRGVDLLGLAACALAYLLVLAADGRIRLRARDSGIAAVIIGGSTVLALVAALITPALQRVWWQGIWVNGAAYGAASLVDLARDLQTASTTEVLRYQTTRSSPPYLQLATLDDYDGTTWVHREGKQAELRSGQAPGVPGLGGGVTTTAYDTQIQIQRLSAERAPAPYPAQRIDGGGGGRWSYDLDDLSITLTGPSLSYLRYTVGSLDVAPTESDLAATSLGDTVPADVAAVLQLPSELPQIITDTAARVTAGQTTMLGKAQALQNYLRASGGFSYAIQTPDDQSANGMQVVASFLERKSGYCVHFASAMTVMARVLGIPARIAIGYLPGVRRVDPSDDQVYYSESNQLLHAWPQLYFPGVGWLDFEPTVGLGAPADYTRAPSAVDGPTPIPDDGSTATAAPPTLPSDGPTDSVTSPQAGAGGDGAIPAGLVGWVIALVLALAALITPNAVRRLRRRRRLRRLGLGGPPGIAWAEIRDTARDVGIVLDPSETPRAFAARLSRSWSAPARAELDALLLEVERVAFGPPGEAVNAGSGLAARTTTVIREIEARGSRQGLARVLPRSLLRPSG